MNQTLFFKRRRRKILRNKPKNQQFNQYHCDCVKMFHWQGLGDMLWTLAEVLHHHTPLVLHHWLSCPDVLNEWANLAKASATNYRQIIWLSMKLWYDYMVSCHIYLNLTSLQWGQNWQLQVMPPVQYGSLRIRDILTSLLHSGRKWRCVVHLLHSLWVKTGVPAHKVWLVFSIVLGMELPSHIME